MFARISTFEGSAQRTSESIRLARRQFLPAARLQEGFRGMYLMFDPQSGRSLAMTLWETEEDMARSEEAVRRARAESATSSGDAVVSVERYEVAALALVPGENGETHYGDAPPSISPRPATREGAVATTSNTGAPDDASRAGDGIVRPSGDETTGRAPSPPGEDGEK